MRWVLTIALLANAGLWIWNVQAARTQEEVSTVVTRAANVTQLVLLEEVDESELRVRRQSAEARASDVQQGDVVAEADEQSPDRSPGSVADSTLNLVSVSLRCYGVGPLADDARDGGVADWLRQRGAHLELREDELRELSRYWVHYEPFASEEEAEKRVELLRAKGFSDMHVIRRGNMKNAVSLGVYSRKAHLERRVATLRDAGFPAEVKERYRTRRASWFDVVLPADNPLSETDLAADYPDVEVRVRPCGDPST